MKPLVLLMSFCAAIAASTPAAGQTLGIESQTREARRVVIGKVTHVQSRFDTNQFGDRLIVSDLLLEVEETLKGAPSNAIEVTIEGGTIGELTLNVSDLPAMKSGDRAVFFLDEPSPGRYVPHKRGLGILRVDGAGRVNAGTTLDDVRRAVRAALP